MHHEPLTKFQEKQLNQHRATTRATRHAQTSEKVTRAMSKFATRHNESDPTHTHTQSDDRVVGATSKLAPHHSPLQEARGLRVLFFNQGLQSTAPATKMSKGKLSPRLCASLRNGNRHLRRGPEPRPGQPAAQTLCEPAQSK